ALASALAEDAAEPTHHWAERSAEQRALAHPRRADPERPRASEEVEQIPVRGLRRRDQHVSAGGRVLAIERPAREAQEGVRERAAHLQPTVSARSGRGPS